jgi:hypothetical protein
LEPGIAGELPPRCRPPARLGDGRVGVGAFAC